MRVSVSKVKHICGAFLLAAVSLLFFTASPAPAAQVQPDIEISPAVTPKDTARYVMMVSTMSGMGMSGQRMLMLDARGLPATATPHRAWHMIPEAMRMGKYLPLIRPERYGGGSGEGGESKQEDWTTKIYWSCAKEVPKGQPIVISTKDRSKQSQIFEAYSGNTLNFWKEPPSGWGWGQWPNKEYFVQVPANGSLKGNHFVHGNYLPHIKFGVTQHDFLNALKVKTGDGNLNAFIPVTWESVPGAIGYFIYAMATNQSKREMVIWTSSQKATYGIQSYEHSSRIKELVNLGVVLKPDVQACNIPAGIFVGYEHPMIMVYAWGNDYWMSYPPKPQNPPKGWKPDWTVNGLFLSQWSGMPGAAETPGAPPEMDEEDEEEEEDVASPAEQPKKGSESKSTTEKQSPPAQNNSGPTININLPSISIPSPF